MVKEFALLLLEKYTEMNTYCRKAKEDIDQTNFKILKKISIMTVIIIVVFIMITPFIIPEWQISCFHVGFLVCAIIFSCFTNCVKLDQNEKNSHILIKIAYCFYLFYMITFMTILDTFLFPNLSQAFCAVFMVAVPILFIISIREMLVIQLYFMISFSIVVLQFKENLIARGDIFNSLLGFVVSIVVYTIVMKVRSHDFILKDKYRISSELDSLTGIANRAACKQRIEHFLINRGPEDVCAMMILDVDNFKEINDKLGHTNGDKVLQEVSAILLKVFRNSDIIGRFGGDEFLIFVKDIYDDKMIDRKCLEIKEQMKLILEGKFNIGCSVGVCVLDKDEASMEEMFHVADEALYEAKTFSKGSYVKHRYVRETLQKQEHPLMVIIDDNMVDREIIGIQFEDKFQIKKFANAREALTYIEAYPYEVSIILLDMIMPEMNGFEFLKYVKSKPEIAWIPVIAVSSDANTEEKALEYGAVDMIIKPIVPAIAKLRVNNIMKKSK